MKQIYVKDNLVKKLKKIALERGTTLQAVCNEAIRQYLEGGVIYNDSNIKNPGIHP
ncbi:ribbon-helix-helix domain-containing protein [Anaeroarcus burkinensis]|uniref:ribbon-helix-helix domain-containing protein n=1 Tax=Anaeroarcus burkinensis TaxID=82376 RepID=UPI0003F79E6A|nr:ribbon-helix-helix domain-containing protein [Anaeroarcus burkinensis]